MHHEIYLEGYDSISRATYYGATNVDRNRRKIDYIFLRMDTPWIKDFAVRNGKGKAITFEVDGKAENFARM